jgi:hypothetical protein
MLMNRADSVSRGSELGPEGHKRRVTEKEDFCGLHRRRIVRRRGLWFHVRPSQRPRRWHVSSVDLVRHEEVQGKKLP